MQMNIVRSGWAVGAEAVADGKDEILVARRRARLPLVLLVEAVAGGRREGRHLQLFQESGQRTADAASP